MTARTRPRRRLAQLLGALAALAVMAWTLRDRVPAPGQVLDALGEADGGWLLVAAVAEFASMALFARQQRRLLTAFGVTLPRRRMLALAYSRSALSISLPAGSAVSAAYAFREFRAGGADRVAATAVMVLSGLLSAVGLVLLYVSGLLTGGALNLARSWDTHPALTGLGVLAVTGAVCWIGYALVAAHRPARPGRPGPARARAGWRSRCARWPTPSPRRVRSRPGTGCWRWPPRRATGSPTCCACSPPPRRWTSVSAPSNSPRSTSASSSPARSRSRRAGSASSRPRCSPGSSRRGPPKPPPPRRSWPTGCSPAG